MYLLEAPKVHRVGLRRLVGQAFQPASPCGAGFPACLALWGRLSSLPRLVGQAFQPASPCGAGFPACLALWGRLSSLPRLVGQAFQPASPCGAGFPACLYVTIIPDKLHEGNWQTLSLFDLLFAICYLLFAPPLSLWYNVSV
jgi:hypothetical protein